MYAQQPLTPERLMEFNRLGNGILSPDEKYFLYGQTQVDLPKNSYTTNWFVIDLKTKENRQISQDSFSISEVQWAGNAIYFLHTDNEIPNIWKMDVRGTNRYQISHFTAEDKKIESFRIAPNERFIIVLHSRQIRQKLFEEYPDLPLANARVEDDLMYRHWDTWNDYCVHHFFYYPIHNEKIKPSGTNIHGDSNDDLGNLASLTFHPNGSKIAYSAKKLTGIKWTLSTNSEIYEFDLQTNTERCITCGSEQFHGYDLQPSYSSQGNLAWISMERNGYESDKRNLVVQTQTGEIKNITQRKIITVDNFAWHPDGKKLYAIAPTIGTDQLFEIDVEKQIIRQITDGSYDYVSLQVGENAIYAASRSMIEPIEYYVLQIPKKYKEDPRSQKNRHFKYNRGEQLTYANQDLLEQLEQPTIQEHWFETTDGMHMHTWIILPPNFDPTKKYPTLLYCQGGPQSQVSQFFSYRWNFMLMASQGYIVVAPNRRGLPGFGQEWNEAISKDWGGQAIQDYLTAIDSAVAQLPYIDKNKLGAIGASYGGYSVYMLAGVHQNRFKTFVAHCGLFNLESWYGTTDELFFANWDIGGPYWQEENRELYLKNSPHRLVKNWNTPLLVIHGGLDFRVPETEGMQAFQAAQIMGVKSRFLHFPTEGHWVLTPQNSLVWHREFFKWLAEDLK